MRRLLGSVLVVLAVLTAGDALVQPSTALARGAVGGDGGTARHEVYQTSTAEPVAIVAVDLLNVRAGPGYEFEIVTQVERGTRLSVTGSARGWLPVRTPGGVVGYVVADYVYLGPSPAVAAPPARRWGARGWGFIPTPEVDGAPSVTDAAGNGVRLIDQTGGRYVFDSEAFLELLRDEGVSGERITVVLMESAYGNRSATGRRNIVLDCNAITVPTTFGRSAPAGNNLRGADFCAAVALHEVYHLVTLVNYGWGGGEADADAFALERLGRYRLVRDANPTE